MGLCYGVFGCILVWIMCGIGMGDMHGGGGMYMYVVVWGIWYVVYMVECVVVCVEL